MRPRRLREGLEYRHAGGMADRLKTEALEHSREQGGMLEAIAAAAALDQFGLEPLQVEPQHPWTTAIAEPDRRTAALAPAYDFVSTISYIPDEFAAIKYARTKRMSEFSYDELRYLAAKAHLPEKLVIDTASETVARFRDEWAIAKKRSAGRRLCRQCNRSTHGLGPPLLECNSSLNSSFF